MRTFCIVNYYRKLYKNVYLRRFCSKSTSKDTENIENTRNIGILAHIDAGKTTTTERMLFYSGTIKSMGEVHHGNTVTDYMEQERQRGITITSAAVSFPWQNKQINLIDTPGHIDFTMEVEQSLAVLDGVVLVLDGSAGVEAQTITVWNQASGYKVPRLFYLNKMDRADADEEQCLKAIEEKLEAQTLQLHSTVRHNDRLIGLIDIVNQEEIIWTQGRGQKFVKRKLTESQDGHKWENTLKKYHKLIDTLSSLDDEIADLIIQEESLDKLSTEEINRAIRRSTIKMKSFPVLCGSSYKNIGVQCLMDAVIDYLPSPAECGRLYKCFGNDLCARVFKVQHDDQRGVLSFLRVYSGAINKAQKIFNLRNNRSEQSGNLYVAYADEYKLVDKVTTGNIAVLSGLKETNSGDLITSSQSAATRAKEHLTSLLKDNQVLHQLTVPSTRVTLQNMDPDASRPQVAEVLLGIGTTIPDPVFLCSIEPPSQAYQTALDAALLELQREDPSLRVTYNDESGQIVLAGMGELHLEIIKERIIREYKIDVELGSLQIAYKETLLEEVKQNLSVDRKIGNARQVVNLTLSVRPEKGVSADNLIRMDKSQDSASNLSRIHPRQLAAITNGVQTALSHGPKLACPIIDVRVTLHWLEVGRGTSDSVLTATASQCIRKILQKSPIILLEPVMSVEVVCPESHSGRVMADLARRRSDILGIFIRHNNKVIECLTPLSELIGYSSTLRSLSSGLASFSMQFHTHRQMTPIDEENAVKSVTGF